MKVLVTGSRGLIGSHLVAALKEQNHDVLRLVRLPTQASSTMILWKPESKEMLDKNRLEGMDAIIHLAGESIADGRWTTDKKARIRDSRIQSTDLLAKTMASLEHPPSVFVSASAVGYYGDTGDTLVDEDSPAGEGFLSSVCRDWEDAAQPAADAGIRLVNLRIGNVLSPKGGALGKMLKPFRMGLGGKIGHGRQFISWITIDDAIRAMLFALEHESLRGPVNLVSPNPVTNLDFTKALGKAVGRPTFFPLPALVAYALFGQEMAQALLLGGVRAKPARLIEAGFNFEHPDIDAGMVHVIGQG